MATNNDVTSHEDGAKDVIQADAMTVVQLKDELKRRKLKTAGNKAELVERFRAAMLLEDQKDDDDDDNDDDDGRDRANRESSDESESSDINGEQRPRQGRERYLLTFKDVEDSIDTFSGDDGKDVKQWIKDFDETASLCQWNDVQKTIYGKKLLRGSAKLFVKYETQGRTWKDIKAALKHEFSQKINSHDVHL
ncbi:hypothetical protein RF55_11594 [Lasius niger]|uniref:SAP domain-containing protein n=1 Tax=Lasius niger TaxID=67767 RepID=A0A0J7KF63_LASNI|nr:hypothetical protein RF55_11594 [Lasius niger]